MLERIFVLSPDVRYVALMQHGRLTFRERDGLAGASSAESDRYEEILVNPTLLTLTGQRGGIDCGGLDYRPHVRVGGRYTRLTFRYAPGSSKRR